MPTFYEKGSTVNPFLGFRFLLLVSTLISTHFLFALSMSFYELCAGDGPLGNRRCYFSVGLEGQVGTAVVQDTV